MTVSIRIDRPFKSVVVVADLFSHQSDLPVAQRRDLEKTERSTLDALLTAIGNLGFDAYHYEGPHALAMNASRHLDDVVLSIYGGESSRNRMALVPSICEVFGLRFVGPDTYGRILCQDKILSKHLAAHVGFDVPSHVILQNEADLARLVSLATTYILKPIAEGSSIGLEQRCVIEPGVDGSEVASNLIKCFGPVMAEEFIPGREVSYNFIRGGDQPQIAFSEIVVEGQPNFFDKRIFDAHEKLTRTIPRHVANIDSLATERDLELVKRLIEAIGTLSYCRVDGKYWCDRFVFLEITPDAWIDPLGAFAGSFIKKGWSYEDVISTILSSPLQQPSGASKARESV